MNLIEKPENDDIAAQEAGEVEPAAEIDEVLAMDQQKRLELGEQHKNELIDVLIQPVTIEDVEDFNIEYLGLENDLGEDSNKKIILNIKAKSGAGSITVQQKTKGNLVFQDTQNIELEIKVNGNDIVLANPIKVGEEIVDNVKDLLNKISDGMIARLPHIEIERMAFLTNSGEVQNLKIDFAKIRCVCTSKGNMIVAGHLVGMEEAKDLGDIAVSAHLHPTEGAKDAMDEVSNPDIIATLQKSVRKGGFLPELIWNNVDRRLLQLHLKPEYLGKEQEILAEFESLIGAISYRQQSVEVQKQIDEKKRRYFDLNTQNIDQV